MPDDISYLDNEVRRRLQEEDMSPPGDRAVDLIMEHLQEEQRKERFLGRTQATLPEGTPIPDFAQLRYERQRYRDAPVLVPLEGSDPYRGQYARPEPPVGFWRGAWRRLRALFR